MLCTSVFGSALIPFILLVVDVLFVICLLILLSGTISISYDIHVVYSNTTGVTSGARTAYRSGAHEWGSC